MNEMIIQVLAALVGSTGFAIFFNMKGKQIALAGSGGALTWIVYLICQNFVGGIFLPYFLAALFVAIYAEIMARINRSPATIFLTAAAVPLIPGGSLYYAMSALVEGDQALFAENGEKAVLIALAISLAFVAVAVVNRYVRFFMKK